MLHKPWIALLILLMTASTAAQEPAVPEYKVEVLVVRNLNPAIGTEVFPLVVEVEESEAPEFPAETFMPLDASELTLSEMAEKISRSRNFRVLNHSGWVQPGFSRETSRGKVFLSTASTGESVTGYVTLIRERYLRLAFDLTLQFEDQQIHLSTQRRMISRQLHYFDNPYFGVIAKITPL